MDIVRQEVLNSINNIELMTMESMLSVYESYSQEYDKILTIMDYAVETGMDTSALFQEGKILDEATGKGKDEGMIKKIIAFVPRLLMSIIKAVASVFTKDYNKENDASIKSAKVYIEKAGEEEIRVVAKTVNEKTEGEVKLDPKTKKLSFGKRFASAWNKGTLLVSGSTVLLRLRQEIKSPNTDYKKFTTELKSVFSGEKKIDEKTLAVSLDTFNTGLKDLFAAGQTVSSACKELSGVLEKKLQEDLAKGEDPKKVQDIKDLIDQIQHVAKYTANTAFAGRVGAVVTNLLGNPDLYVPWSEKSKAKARSGTEKLVSQLMRKTIYADDFDELDDLGNQVKDKGRDIRATKAQDKIEEDLHQKKMKARKDLKDISAEKEKVDKDAAVHKSIRETENDLYDNTGMTTHKHRKRR